MKQGNSHLLHGFKVKNDNYVITLAQVGCGCRGVDKGAAGAAFAAPIIGENVNGISGTKNYLIVRKDKLRLKLKINVCTFNFWVPCIPESVASYREMGR